MILIFAAGVRNVEGAEPKLVVRADDDDDDDEDVGRGELYEDAVAAVTQKIAVHSGAANSWCEVLRSAGAR